MLPATTHLRSCTLLAEVALPSTLFPISQPCGTPATQARHKHSTSTAHQHELRHQVGVWIIGVQCCRVLRHAEVKQLLVPLVAVKACGIDWVGREGGGRKGWAG